MTGYGSRQGVVGIPGLSVRTLFVISVAGGALGALLLLATPSDFFTALVRGWCCSQRPCSLGQLRARSRSLGTN